jgi:hypothetical protein
MKLLLYSIFYSNTALVLVGAGSEEQKLKTLVAVLALDESVGFDAHQLRGNMTYYYIAAHVILLSFGREWWQIFYWIRVHVVPRRTQ